MKREYKVYCHTCKANGKRYIGCTSMNVKDRWSAGRGYCKQPKFYSDIQKYGWDGFTHEVVFDHMDKETAELMEGILIKEFHTNECGYNRSTSGKRVNAHHTAESKKRISESNKGKMAWNKGIPMTKNQKEKISKANKGRVAPNRRKMVNKETGEVYESLLALSKIAGTGSSNIISGMKNPNSKYYKYEYLQV